MNVRDTDGKVSCPLASVAITRQAQSPLAIAIGVDVVVLVVPVIVPIQSTSGPRSTSMV